MIKPILKTLLITILCICSFLAKAQVGYDYAQYDIGFAAGLNNPSGTDVTTAIKKTPSAHFNLTYNQTPFLNYVFEGQFGRLKAGDPAEGYGLQFENHFALFFLKVQLQAGELIDYSQSNVLNAFKNLYLSTGVGYLVNHVVEKADVGLPGDNNTNIPVIPARIGYEIKIFNQYNEPSVKIDLGYQYNFVMNDNLDGYNTKLLNTKYANDMFTQFTLGVKFAIGGVTSYRKQINY